MKFSIYQNYFKALIACLFNILIFFFVSPAYAESQNVQGEKFYYVTYEETLYSSGLEACTRAVKRMRVDERDRYTDPGFIAPSTCSYTYDYTADSAPPVRRESGSLIGIKYMCPGGTFSSPQGIYNKVDNEGLCQCEAWQRFFPDALGFKKCVRVDEVTTEQPPMLPSDNGPTCAGKGSPSCGQPINPATGNMWHVETDYKIADSRSGLAVRRTYNSNPLHWDAGVSRTFGARWTQQYDVTIKPDVARPLNGTLPHNKCWRRSDTSAIVCELLATWVPNAQLIPDAVSILRGDGKRYLFNRDGMKWVSNADNNDRLVAIYDSENTVVVGWEFKPAWGDQVEKFDARGRLISITDRNGLTQRFTYSDGQSNNTTVGRIPIDSPACSNIQSGATLTAGLLLCVTDYAGRQLQFEYDEKGRIAKAITPSHLTISYEYDGPSGGCDIFNEENFACVANNLTKVTSVDGSTRIYFFNEAAQINQGTVCPGFARSLSGLGHLPNAWTGLIDENGDRHMTWTYDCMGRATSSQRGNMAEKVAINYGSYTAYPYTGAKMSVIHYSGMPDKPVASTTVWYFDKILGVGKLRSIDKSCRECGDAKILSYDINGNITRREDWIGNIVSSKYDLARNLEVKRVEGNAALSYTFITEWHPEINVPTKLVEPKRISTFTYDSLGNLLTRTIQATTDELGTLGLMATLKGSPRTWQYSYNTFGQVISTIGPKADGSDITRFVYDSNNSNLIQVINPAGHITTLSNYDIEGRVGTIIWPNGIKTDFEYSSRGWLKAEVNTGINGSSLRTTYEYDRAGQLIFVKQFDQSSMRFSYDSAHRLTDIADTMGNRIHYVLDIMGNRVHEQVVDKNGDLVRQVTRIFNSMQRLMSVTGATQ